MKSLRTVSGVREWRAVQADVGLVLTMGFLHEGHLSLVRRARAENASVVASVFVNPSQFDRGEDLAAYPRDVERDLRLLAESGCDMVFVPEPEELYPSGFQTWVEVGEVAEPLEGAHRPGHFRGVATVVTKLFGIIQPTRSYFGLKDAQQMAVIRTMTRDLNLPVDVVGCPTVREADGLAMSSRNARLEQRERQAATVLFRALMAAREAWSAGEANTAELRATMAAVLTAEPLAKTIYVSVADPSSMTELDEAAEGALLSLAVQVGPVRLIDNLLLEAASVAGQGAGDASTTRGTS